MLALLCTACGEDEVPTTPTPFDMGQTAVAIIAGSQPTAVTLAELSADSEAYADQYLQLAGAYQHLPLLVCNGETLRSMAGWLLVENPEPQEVDEEVGEGEEEEKSEPALVAAGGFDSQLRHLVPEGTPLIVNGYWRYWEGPVGCGKQAVPRQIWYLKVTEIVEPAQLARVPITPGASTPEDGSETAVPTEEGDGAPGFPITPTLPVPITATQPLPEIPTPPVVLTSTPTLPSIPSPTLPPVEPTPTVEREDEGTPSTTPEGSTVTPTLTNTPPPGASLTPTPTPGTPTPGTPTVTAQPGTYTIIEVDPINPDEAMYGVETMGPWQKQNWPLTLTNSEVITIGIAAEPTMDLAIAVYDEADNELIEQNNAPAGQLERVVNLRVDPEVAYIIQIYETNGREGAYFMTIVGDQTEVVLNSRGILTYGQTRQDMLAEDHRHFWYFYGNAGEVIDITTTTDADKLILISLYDMNADLIVDEDGIELEYVEEEILDLELPETGLYLIWLEEFAYEAAPYTITVRNN